MFCWKAFHHATVFFIECRNLPQSHLSWKGSAVPFDYWTRTRLLQYRLCYIWRYTPDRNCLQAFVWKGRTTGLVPDFFQLQGGAGALSVHLLFSEHFHFVTLNSSLNDVVFSIRFMDPGLVWPVTPFTIPSILLIDVSAVRKSWRDVLPIYPCMVD
jgi:hypothetical protein